MRIILLSLLLIFCNSGFSQNEKPPTKEQMQAELQQSIRDAKQEIEETKKQIAEAKKNKDDPESIDQLQKQLESLQQMVTLLEKTNITAMQAPKTLSPSKTTEPAYVSPFTPITLKQPAKAPAWEQATDQLLWYRGRRIDPNTLITPTGFIVRYDLQNNMVIYQPSRTDTPYYNLVNTLGQVRQLKKDYSQGMRGLMNSFFMFPLIEDAYKEYDLFKNTYYELARNNIQLNPTHRNTSLESMIQNLADFLRHLPPLNMVPPPKRPNDLCLCQNSSAQTRYQNSLKSWVIQFYSEEYKILQKLMAIYERIESMKLQGIAIPAVASSLNDPNRYFEIILERMTAKLTDLSKSYQQGDVLIEDGLVYAASTLLDTQTELNAGSRLRATNNGINRIVDDIGSLVMSDLFERYIEDQKSQKNFNAVFDYGLYLAHELNKKQVYPQNDINKNLFELWMKGLEKFNRFKLNIEINFDYQQVNKEDDDDLLLMASGSLKSDELIVSLGRNDCSWIFYLKNVNHQNRNTNEKEFEIPMNVVTGSKDFLKDKYPPFPYTGPSILKMVFPTFKISFCGTGSTVMMDALRYEPADVERHKNDDVSKKYSMDMQFFVNKLFLSAVKTKMDVNELISTSVQMINIQSSQTPASSGDPAFDHMHMEYLMNKKKYELQYSLSQTSHTEKTVIPLRLDPPGSSRLFNPTVDVVDTNDPDREKGMVMKKGIVTLKAEHSPN